METQVKFLSHFRIIILHHRHTARSFSTVLVVTHLHHYGWLAGITSTGYEYGYGI